MYFWDNDDYSTIRTHIKEFGFQKKQNQTFVSAILLFLSLDGAIFDKEFFKYYLFVCGL